MGNCLVTKLKGSIDSDLPTMYDVDVVLSAGESLKGAIWQTNASNSQVRLVSGSVTVNTSGVSLPYTIPSESSTFTLDITAGAEGAVLRFSHKESLKCVDCILLANQPDNISYLNQFPNLSHIMFNKGGNTRNLSLSGNLQDLMLTNLRYVNFNESSIYGDFKYMGRNAYLGTLAIYYGNIEGSLESYVIEARKVLATNSTGLTVTGAKFNNLTFGGSNIQTDHKLTWEASGTNTVIHYNGATVTIDADGNVVS